jgi:hypothetical protein
MSQLVAPLSVERIVNRAINVAKLDLPTYRQIARDPSATTEAAVVVGAVALAAGIGAITDSLGQVIVSVIGAFVWWLVFSAVTWFFGKNMFGTPSAQITAQSLMRTIGYARAPQVLYILGFIPLIGWAFAALGWCLAIVTSVVAIRETLVIGTGKALLLGLLSVIASGLIVGILGLVFAGSWAF